MERNMILPQSRYQTGYRPEKRRRGPIIIITIVSVLLVGAVLIFFLTPKKLPVDISVDETTLSPGDTNEEGDVSPEALWKQGDYSGVLSWSNRVLDQDPLSLEALIYHGFASFYYGIGQYTPEEQLPVFDDAIADLRRALLFDDVPMKAQIQYVLGKTYYHKGRYYADLALRNLLASEEEGYEGDDTLEYIGLAYGELGQYQKSLDYFLKAVEKEPSDILYLTIGQTYDKMELYKEAEAFLLKAIGATEDEGIEQKSRFLLGSLYMDRGELEKAKSQYEKILETNKRSADAYYYLGEVFEKQNNRVKARAEWRRALEIDPSHYGALTKLY
ncbi:Tetratricopeptide TPR_2 repeat protein [Sediminispirochaeta smaragdinae DSM 11293]|uniref:Tetratricopeptide TPR_2 repeat protein n=2 Tax=Sediminispirochaeta TaxID=1911556 RepID=E1R312_SEDSS|nr:Tetratricopeptide TPR_2 repeat protein [Sediminispirochaeta smaragdinae DSM 11293]